MIGALVSSATAVVTAIVAAFVVWMSGPAEYLYGLLEDAWPQLERTLDDLQPYVKFVDAWIDLSTCFDMISAYLTFISVLSTFKFLRSFLGL